MQRELNEEDEADGQALLLRAYEAAEPRSLTLLLLSSHTDAAAFIRQHTSLFVCKTLRLVVMGGVSEASLSEDAEAFAPDQSANMSSDAAAAAFVFDSCQELGVGMLIFTRFCAYASAAALPQSPSRSRPPIAAIMPVKTSLPPHTRSDRYAAPLHGFAFDELATIGHPVALRLRERQVCELH